MLTPRRLVPLVGLLGLSMLATACPPPPPPAPLVVHDPASLGEANVVGDGEARSGSVSRDGRFVLFGSSSSNVLTTPLPSGSTPALYLRDLETGGVQLVAESQGYGRLSGNGRYVTFQDGTKVTVWDRTTEQSRVFVPGDVTNLVPFVSDHGTTVVWGAAGSVFSPSVGNACGVHDLVSGAETMCPPPTGAPAVPGAATLVNTSRNTRFVLYQWTNWADQSDPFNGPKLWDRSTGTVTDIGAPITVFGSFAGGAVSDDGRFVLGSDSSIQPVVVDLVAHSTLHLPVTPNRQALSFDISSDGRYVALGTSASNLSPVDTNGVNDLYVWDTATGAISLVGRNLDDGTTLAGETWACGWTTGTFTDVGQVCAQSSESMASIDDNGQNDIYVLPFA